MANIRLIRRRIRGIESTAKITRAMEMIAASRMRKAQERGLAGRPYSEKITQVIGALSNLSGAEQIHPLLERRQPKNIYLILITPDRGLAGGLVSNLTRKVAEFILGQKVPVKIIAVGQKGIDFARRTGRPIVAEFSKLGDQPDLRSTLPASRIVIDDFIKGECDEVYIAYARFVNTMVQEPEIKRLIPVEPASLAKGTTPEYIFEPNPQEVLGGLLPRFIEMEVYHTILESIASEQSARMVAMRNATNNAYELIGGLTLLYNKARQESITEELLDIVGGAEALT